MGNYQQIQSGKSPSQGPAQAHSSFTPPAMRTPRSAPLLSALLLLLLCLPHAAHAKPKPGPAPTTPPPPPLTTPPPPLTTPPPPPPPQPTTVISSSFADFSNNSDLYLRVPALAVDRVELNASLIDAHVRFSVSLGSLFVVQGSVDVTLRDFSLTADDVKTQLEMSVRLMQVQAMFARLMESLDQNPTLLPVRCLPS